MTLEVVLCLPHVGTSMHTEKRTLTGPEVLANAQPTPSRDSFPRKRKASGIPRALKEGPISAECQHLGEAMLAGCCVSIPSIPFSRVCVPFFRAAQDGREGQCLPAVSDTWALLPRQQLRGEVGAQAA